MSESQMPVSSKSILKHISYDNTCKTLENVMEEHYQDELKRIANDERMMAEKKVDGGYTIALDPADQVAFTIPNDESLFDRYPSVTDGLFKVPD